MLETWLIAWWVTLLGTGWWWCCETEITDCGYCTTGTTPLTISVTIPDLSDSSLYCTWCEGCDNFPGTYVIDQHPYTTCHWYSHFDNPAPSCDEKDGTDYPLLLVAVNLNADAFGSDDEVFVRLAVQTEVGGDYFNVATWVNVVSFPIDCGFTDYEVVPEGEGCCNPDLNNVVLNANY